MTNHTARCNLIFSRQVWVVAAREVFMTWGLCGAVVMQITSHNRYSHSLRRDITVVIGVTLFVLTLTGFVACTCLQIIKIKGHYDYVPSSFGRVYPSFFFVEVLDVKLLQKRTEAGGFYKKGSSTTRARNGARKTSTTTSSWEWRFGTTPTVLAIGRATSR